MSIKLSDLKLPKVRKVIEHEVNGEKKIITIFNPTGKKRNLLLQMLSAVDQTDEENTNVIADTLYKSLLRELVDIEVDMKSTLTLDKYPTLALMEMNKELEEIMFELQYEYICEQIRRVNHATITAMSGILLGKTNKVNELIENLNNSRVE